MSTEEQIKDKLVTAGIGVFEATIGWAIHIGNVPTAPDTAIVITRTGGQPPDPKWLLDTTTFQIRVRGNKGNYKTAQTKAQAIKDLLLGIASETLPGGDRWVSVTLLSDIAFMGYDDTMRPNFVLNLRMIIEPAVPGVTNRAPI